MSLGLWQIEDLAGGHWANRQSVGLTLDDWQPISSAPRDRELYLSVIEDGEVHSLQFPCCSKGSQWTHAKGGKLIDINPMHWRERNA